MLMTFAKQSGICLPLISQERSITVLTRETQVGYCCTKKLWLAGKKAKHYTVVQYFQCFDLNSLQHNFENESKLLNNFSLAYVSDSIVGISLRAVFSTKLS